VTPQLATKYVVGSTLSERLDYVELDVLLL